MGEQTFGVPFDIEHVSVYHLRPHYSPAIERVLSAIYYSRHGSIDLCPLIPILARIMLHFIDEWEVFAVLTHLMSRTAWVDQGQAQLSASISTLHNLIQTHLVSPATSDGHKYLPNYPCIEYKHCTVIVVLCVVGELENNNC